MCPYHRSRLYIVFQGWKQIFVIRSNSIKYRVMLIVSYGKSFCVRHREIFPCIFDSLEIVKSTYSSRASVYARVCSKHILYNAYAPRRYVFVLIRAHTAYITDETRTRYRGRAAHAYRPIRPNSNVSQYVCCCCCYYYFIFLFMETL